MCIAHHCSLGRYLALNLGLEHPPSCGQMACNLHTCVKYITLTAVLTDEAQNLEQRWPFTRSLFLVHMTLQSPFL